MRADASKSGPLDIAIGPWEQPVQLTNGGAKAYLDRLGALAEAGATWAMVELPYPSLQAYTEMRSGLARRSLRGLTRRMLRIDFSCLP